MCTLFCNMLLLYWWGSAFSSPKLCSWCRQRVDVWDICHDCWPLRPQVTNRPIRLFEMMCLKWCNSALKLFLLRVGLDQIRQPSLISKMNIETSKKAVILWFSVTNPFTSKTVVQKNNYNYVLVTQVEKMWRLHKKVQKPQKQSPSHISGVGDTFFLSLLLLFFFSPVCALKTFLCFSLFPPDLSLFCSSDSSSVTVGAVVLQMTVPTLTECCLLELFFFTSAPSSLETRLFDQRPQSYECR